MAGLIDGTRVLEREVKVPNFESEAMMCVNIYFKGNDENVYNKSHCEKLYDEACDALAKIIAKNNGFPYPRSEIVKDYMKEGYIIERGIKVDETSELMRCINNDVISKLIRAKLLVYLPNLRKFKIAPNANAKMLAKLGIKACEIYNNEYSSFILSKMGAPLNKKNCYSSFD